MKNPKKKQKTPFTRRQFVGSCAAGASMISLAPYLSFAEWEDAGQRNDIPLAECEKIKHKINYSNGEMEIIIKFTNPHMHQKKIPTISREDDFSLVKFCKTGFITTKERGGPELPYFGLIFHMPDCLNFDEPVQAYDEDRIMFDREFKLFPAQYDVQDNVNYLGNYKQKPDYNKLLYTNTIIDKGYLDISRQPQIIPKDNNEYQISDSIENNFKWIGPYYIGESRYFILELLPLLPNENGQWTLRENIKIHIKNIQLISHLPENKYLDTPYLPEKFDRLPKHERIVDPWSNKANTQQIIPGFKPNSVEDYEEVGPDLIVLYQKSQKKNMASKMKMQARRLISHKRKFGYEHARAHSLENKDNLNDPQKVRDKVKSIISQYPFIANNKGFQIPRLNSIILLGDIPWIEGIDLYGDIYPESLSTKEVNPDSEKYFSDFCVATPTNKAPNVKSRWPNIAIGRIPAKTIAEARLVIDNIIDYDEMSHQEEISKKLTLVSYFQDRGPGSQKLDHVASNDYLQCVEELRQNIDNSRIDMIYQTENPDKDVRKHKYRDGSDLDESIRFLDTEDAKNMILNSFRNGGRFIVHRDHGWMNGWAYPNLKIPDLWKVNCTCSDPTIVFNINCLSGRFTGEKLSIINKYNMPKNTNDSFSEVLLKGPVLPSGERINLRIPVVIASTEISPSYENDWFLKIMFDRIYGGILTDRPEGFKKGKQRIGDVFNIGKIMLGAYQGDRGLHIHENVVFHILGDPTLKV